MEKEFTKEQATITAEKITTIFRFVCMMDDVDLEYLKKISEDMEAQTSQLRSVQGVMVDYDRAERQMEWNKQAQDRIKGILMIREAVENTPSKSVGREENEDKEAIAKMFGL